MKRPSWLLTADLSHLHRTCVFSRIARVTRLYFSNTPLHPGIGNGYLQSAGVKET